MVYDCAMSCVSESTASYYTGDGTCDDGTWGYDLTCSEFSYDDGDCDGGGGGGGGGIGDSCGSGLVYDCAMSCVSESTAYAYMGDGSCDDGTWGYDLTCSEFSYDAGDCDGGGGGGSGGGVGDSCGSGMVYDCAMSCVYESTAASYIGDGTCDDGTWGYDLTCAEFSYDDFDCFV